jgi:hypothetical protein
VESYKNLAGNSPIRAYEITGDSITVQFASQFDERATYLYNYDRPGRKHVERMKRLAVEGRGLSTYIAKFVRDGYAEKLT